MDNGDDDDDNDDDNDDDDDDYNDDEDDDDDYDDDDDDDDYDNDDDDDLLLGLSFSGQLHPAHHLKDIDCKKMKIGFIVIILTFTEHTAII